MPRPMLHLGSIVSVALLAAACSATGPADPDAGGLTQSAFVPQVQPIYQIEAFDTSTLVVSATNGFGQSIAVPFDTDTAFRRALLHRYAPTDPCRTLAQSYNTVSSTDGYFGVVAGMAANACHARILVDRQTGAVRSYEPSPFYGTPPVDE